MSVSNDYIFIGSGTLTLPFAVLLAVRVLCCGSDNAYKDFGQTNESTLKLSHVDPFLLVTSIIGW